MTVNDNMINNDEQVDCVCRACGGRGAVDYDDRKCRACSGSGRVVRTRLYARTHGMQVIEVPKSGPFFVLVTVPVWSLDGRTRSLNDKRSIIGPFSTWDAAQQWRDTRISADGATSEILTPETPR